MKKSYLMLLCSLLITIVVFFSNIKWIDKPISNTKEDISPIVDVYDKQIVSQKIKARNKDIEEFSLYFGNYQNEFDSEELIIKLYDENEEYYNTSLNAKDINDDEEKHFQLDKKIEDSKNKEYTIEVSCPKCDEDHKMALFGELTRDYSYPLSVNNESKINFTVQVITTGKIFDYGKLIFFVIVNLIFIGIAIYDILKDKKAIISNKISIILEFVIALLTTFLLYKVIYINVYFNRLSFLHFGCLLISLILLCGIIVYRFIHYKKQENLFLTLMIPIGLLYLVFLPPNQVADENGHYNSAFNIQNGDFLNVKHSIEILSFVNDNGRNDLTSYFRLNKVLSEKADYNDTRTFHATGYNPIFYFPATIGIFVGKILNIPIFWGYYLARLLTFITYLFLLYLAIKIVPFGKSLLLVYMFNPMAIHQSISVSADALLNAYIILYICNVLHLLHKKNINKKDVGLLTLGNISVALAKYVYLPLELLSLLLLFKKDIDSKTKKMIVFSFVFSFVIYLALLFYKSFINVAPPVDQVIESNVSFAEQLKFLIKDPNNIILMFSKTLANKGDFYFTTFFGQSLSWLCLPIPLTIICAYFATLVLSVVAFKDEQEPTKLEKISLFVISLGIMILIILGMNLTWTSVGTFITEGVQGRYFYPVVIGLLLALVKKNRDIKIKNVYIKFSSVLVIINLLVILEIIKYFI